MFRIGTTTSRTTSDFFLGPTKSGNEPQHNKKQPPPKKKTQTTFWPRGPLSGNRYAQTPRVGRSRREAARLGGARSCARRCAAGWPRRSRFAWLCFGFLSRPGVFLSHLVCLMWVFIEVPEFLFESFFHLSRFFVHRFESLSRLPHFYFHPPR